MPVEYVQKVLCDRGDGNEGAKPAKFVDFVTTTEILLCDSCREEARKFFAPGTVGPGGTVQGIDSLEYLIDT
ncbi:hypothetical protein [Umezawaea sp. NPDC059074]|uniref:hypothetical protein n=1 Tax=Umezawaea sp. NPDC059074 TaxID=3346716 RepID=UPI0036B1033A